MRSPSTRVPVSMARSSCIRARGWIRVLASTHPRRQHVRSLDPNIRAIAHVTPGSMHRRAVAVPDRLAWLPCRRLVRNAWSRAQLLLAGGDDHARSAGASGRLRAGDVGDSNHCPPYRLLSVVRLRLRADSGRRARLLEPVGVSVDATAGRRRGSEEVLTAAAAVSAPSGLRLLRPCPSSMARSAARRIICCGRRAGARSPSMETAAKPRSLRPTQDRIGDTLRDGNGARVAVVNLHD